MNYKFFKKTYNSHLKTILALILVLWIGKAELSAQSTAEVMGYLQNAGLPPTAYNWVLPEDLTCCHDIFVMPHADPVWASHGRLFSWTKDPSTPGGCDGSVWSACHAVTALETCVIEDDCGNRTGFASETIDVIPAPVPPVATDDAYLTTPNNPITFNPLENDTDPNLNIDASSFTFTGATDTGTGIFVLNGDGTVTYTPNANFEGTEMVTYQICDDKEVAAVKWLEMLMES